MAENVHSTPSPLPLAEEQPVENVIWTIGGTDKVEVQKVERTQPMKPISSSVINQSSSGTFELQEAAGIFNQREDPSNVKARIAYSVLMVLTGVCLIAAGVISEVKSDFPGSGVPFWVIGTLLLFPGLYCAWDSLSTYKLMQMTERQQIIKDPEEAE